MKQEVVAGTLPDDFEVVDRCFDERKSCHVRLEAERRDASPLLFVPADRPCPADALRLKMHVHRNVIGVDGGGDQYA
jgi:hypothetical protein